MLLRSTHGRNNTNRDNDVTATKFLLFFLSLVCEMTQAFSCSGSLLILAENIFDAFIWVGDLFDILIFTFFAGDSLRCRKTKLWEYHILWGKAELQEDRVRGRQSYRSYRVAGVTELQELQSYRSYRVTGVTGVTELQELQSYKKTELQDNRLCYRTTELQEEPVTRRQKLTILSNGKTKLTES